jgi:hypothetical protein
MSMASALAQGLDSGDLKTREVKVRNADGSETIRIVPDQAGQSFTSAAEPTKSEARVVGRSLVDAAGRVLYRDPEASGPDAGISLTPAALDTAARRYLTDGTLPAMGMGRNGATARQAIINRAAEIDPNADIAGSRANFQADTGSLKKLQQQSDAVTAFENTAKRNAKLFSDMLGKIPDGGSRFANAPMRSLSSAFGSEDMANFNVLRQSLANEYARIISNPNLSGVMSDSAREEGSALLNPNATVGQLRAAMATLAAEAENRRLEFDSQISSVKKRMGGGRSGGGGTAVDLGLPGVTVTKRGGQ